MSHVTHTYFKQSAHTVVCSIALPYVCMSLIYTSLIYTCDTCKSRIYVTIYMSHELYLCMSLVYTSLIYTCDTCKSHAYMSLIYTCFMTHSYAWHDSYIPVTWLIHMRDMTHIYLWHDLFICVTWLIHTRAMTTSTHWWASLHCQLECCSRAWPTPLTSGTRDSYSSWLI